MSFLKGNDGDIAFEGSPASGGVLIISSFCSFSVPCFFFLLGNGHGGSGARPRNVQFSSLGKKMNRALTRRRKRRGKSNIICAPPRRRRQYFMEERERKKATFLSLFIFYHGKIQGERK